MRKSTPYRKISDADLGYLAGILDGEGHLGIVRRRRTWADGQGVFLRPVVQIGQAKRGLLDHIANVVGAGCLAIHGNRIFYNLRFYPGTLRWLLPQLLPHLVVKRRQAEILIKFLDECKYHGKKLNAEQLLRRELLAEEVRRLNEKPAAQRRREMASVS